MTTWDWEVDPLNSSGLLIFVETVQVIAFLTAAFGKRGDSSDKKRMRLARDRELRYPRVLIICPGSVMLNWERELNTVRSSLDVGTDSVVGMVAYCVVPWSK